MGKISKRLTSRSLLGEELDLVVGVDGFGTFLPSGWANFSVLIGKLEGLDDSDGLLDGATHGKVVDMGSSKGAFGVDEEGPTESDTFLGKEDTVGFGGGMVPVGKLHVGSSVSDSFSKNMTDKDHLQGST